MIQTRPILAAVLLAGGIATQAPALDVSGMTKTEREAFRAEIRAYLLENPEVLMEAIEVLESREAVTQANTDAALVKANYDALVRDENSWVGGNPDGDITIIEFLDYRCGFCKRAFPEVEELVSSDGNIRLIVKEFPILGPQSVLASRFAIAAKMLEGDDAYKAVHDALISFRGPISDASLANVAMDLGFEPAPVLAKMTAPEVDEVIADNRALAQAMQITGTPTFVIGGQMLRGFLPLEGMQALVAEERG
ncbi:MAG: DsbA family protein [Pseudomonadota bacterium]